jgi:hypothetical protein
MSILFILFVQYYSIHVNKLSPEMPALCTNIELKIMMLRLIIIPDGLRDGHPTFL